MRFASQKTLTALVGSALLMAACAEKSANKDNRAGSASQATSGSTCPQGSSLDCPKHEADATKNATKDEGEPAETSKTDELLAKIPLFILAAKTIVGEKLADDPKTRDEIFAILDKLDEHKLALLTGDGEGAAVDDILALIQKQRPEIRAEDLATYRPKILAALATARASYADGQPGTDDFLKVIVGVMAQLPPELTASIAGELDLETLAALLSSSGFDLRAKAVVPGAR